MKKKLYTPDIQTAIGILKSHDVSFAALFGSITRGDESSKSDIDILIRFSKPKTFFEYIRLERLLSKELGRDVDLVTEGSLSPYVRKAIQKDIKVLYE